MDCPRKHEPLKEIELEGVLVDICPTCGGVWFDPNEMKISMKPMRTPGGNYWI